MPVTITGGKYASATLTSAGTTTVTVGTTPFVAADFLWDFRTLALFSSAGAYKGMAYVRRWLSTSSLELESSFFWPLDGSAVTQVVGDTVLVSKNWADVATTGIAVDGDRVTITDTITFGTSGSDGSLCFHDEFKQVRCNTAALTNVLTVAGGQWSCGHMQDFATLSYYGGCNFTVNPTGSDGRVYLRPSSTAAVIFQVGGTVQTLNRNTSFNTGLYPQWFNAQTGGGSAKLLHAVGVELYGVDAISPSAGGLFPSNPTNHKLTNCLFSGAHPYQMLLRWGNGVISGGRFKVNLGSSAPLAILGTEGGNGTYSISAPAGQRIVVADMGGPAGGASSDQIFWRSFANNNVDLNATNVITTDRRSGGFNNNGTYPAAPPANTNNEMYWYFADSYTGLINNTVGGVVRDSDWTLDSSGTAASNALALTVYHQRTFGFSTDPQRGPWTNRLRLYGYDELEYAVAESDYSLGTAGTAKNVTFGGLQNPVARPSLTDVANEATALAITGVTVTDHGASPVSWNSKNWSITITGDLTANPGLTAAQVWAHVKAKISSLSAWGVKAGILWHVLIDENPSGAGYVSYRGKSGGAGASLKGVRVIDQAGNPFPGFVGMVADDGTTYVPPVTYSLTLTGLVAGSEVRAYTGTDPATAVQIAAIESSGTSYAINHTSGGVAGFIVVRKTDYKFIKINLTYDSADVSQPVSQVQDPWYANP